MREILEDCVVIYRQEVENLLIIAAPAIVLGPVCVLVASYGLRPALATIPVLLLLYVGTYAGCVGAARLVMSGAEPTPAEAYQTALSRLPALLIAALPLAFLVGGVAAAALVVSDVGFPLVSLGIGALGIASFAWWAGRHAYDFPLVIGYDLGGGAALRDGPRIIERGADWTKSLLVMNVLPLLAAFLFSWGVGMLTQPALAGTIFTAATALWLPFAALATTAGCTRELAEASDADAASGRLGPA